MTRIVAAVISDRGPDAYLPGALQDMSLYRATVDHIRVVDDSAHRLGLAGAVREAWTWALGTGTEYLLHFEEDFRLAEPVDLEALAYVLDRNPHLAQVVMKRQPWSPEEMAAGGIVEMDPDAYTDRTGLRQSARWCEHDRIFSLNPCLIPRRVLEMGWPDGNEAEFTQMCRDAGLRFAFYGHKLEPPVVTHVGAVRAAGWRL